MKKKLNKDAFDKLNADLQKEYVLDEDSGEYILTVEGEEDSSALKRAKDYEKEKRKKAEARARELEEQVEELTSQVEDFQTNAPDKAKLEAKLKEKFDKEKLALETERNTLSKELERICVEEVADSIARDLSDSPGVIKPHIRSRLAFEIVDGKAKTRIKDAEGELSALTVDELKGEFTNNKDFAAILKGSGGSGSGANGGQGGNGGGNNNSTQKPDFTTASSKEIAAYRKSQKQTNVGA